MSLFRSRFGNGIDLSWLHVTPLRIQKVSVSLPPGRNRRGERNMGARGLHDGHPSLGGVQLLPGSSRRAKSHSGGCTRGVMRWAPLGLSLRCAVRSWVVTSGTVVGAVARPVASGKHG